jgi:hypothetical protein
MAALTGNLISDSYLGLLKTTDNAIITSVTKSITDGAGNTSSLWLSSNLAKVSGSLDVTGSYISLSDGIIQGHTTITTANVTVEDHQSIVGAYMDLHGLELYSGSNFIDFTAAAQAFGSNGSGSLIAVSNDQSEAVPVIGFQNHDNWADGTVSILTPFQAQANAQVTGSLKISGSAIVLAGITGSLSGTATNAVTLNSTASAIFAITGSNTFTGTQVVSGSLRMYESASFVLPTHQPTSPVVGTAFFSGSFLYIYNGSAFVSASLS